MESQCFRTLRVWPSETSFHFIAWIYAMYWDKSLEKIFFSGRQKFLLLLLKLARKTHWSLFPNHYVLTFWEKKKKVDKCVIPPWNQTLYIRASTLRVILTLPLPRTAGAIWRHFLVFRAEESGVAIGLSWEEARDVAKNVTIHRTAPTIKHYLA